MIRFDNISCFSLNELLKINSESEIKTYINGFVCNKNTEIESYLKNSDKLISLYQNKGFKTFNIRKSKSGEERKLIQMYRLI